MDEIGVGEAVEDILGDEATKKDVVAWVTKKGYKVVSETKEGKKFKLIIRSEGHEEDNYSRWRNSRDNSSQ
jgi:TusA-related sulfurtransferase